MFRTNQNWTSQTKQAKTLFHSPPSLPPPHDRGHGHGADRVTRAPVRLALVPPPPATAALPRRGAAPFRRHSAAPAPRCRGCTRGLAALLARAHGHPRALDSGAAAVRRVPRWNPRVPQGTARTGVGEAVAASGRAAAVAPTPAEGERDRAHCSHRRRGGHARRPRSAGTHHALWNFSVFLLFLLL